MTVHKLTKDNIPPHGRRVWLWRDDQLRWVVENMTRSISYWVGDPNLAYTHWCELVEPPVPTDG